MAKTLGAVERKLRTLEEEWGYPQDWGTYALRFGKAIGAKGFLTSTARGVNGYFNPRPLAQLPGYVKACLAEFKEKRI